MKVRTQLYIFTIICFILTACGTGGGNNSENSLTADDYYNRGNIHRDNEEYLEAIENYTKSLEITLHPYSYNERGICYAELEQYNLAIDDFSSAIALNSSEVIYYNNRGRAYAMAEQYSQALSDLAEAINLDPSYVKSYRNRAQVYYDTGESYLGLQDINRAIELDPGNPRDYNKRAYFYIGLNQLDLALESVNTALSIESKAMYFDTRGDVYKAMGETRLMCQDYTLACDLSNRLASEIPCINESTYCP